MHKGADVTYQGEPGKLLDFRLGMVGDVDERGRGVLVPAMIADVELKAHSGKVRRVVEVPLKELRELG